MMVLMLLVSSGVDWLLSNNAGFLIYFGSQLILAVIDNSS